MNVKDLKVGQRFLIDRRYGEYRDPEWFDAEVIEFSKSKKMVKIKWFNKQNDIYYDWEKVEKVRVGELLNNIKINSRRKKNEGRKSKKETSNN